MNLIENSHAWNNARTCHIHDEQSFAIDDDCPACCNDADNPDIEIYQEHIETIENQNRKLKRKLQAVEIQRDEYKEKWRISVESEKEALKRVAKLESKIQRLVEFMANRAG